jgi:hypothetical protein
MDIDKRIQEDKDNIGWTVMGIGQAPDFPNFNYTVGMVDHQLPEIICVGLPITVSHHIINDICNRMMDGLKIKTNKQYDQFSNLPLQFIEVNEDHVIDKMCLSTRTAKRSDFKALQMVWCDTKGKFPWEDNFETKFISAQPLLNEKIPQKIKTTRHIN